MADVNVNAHADQAPTMAPPTRTDDQILPHIRCRKHKLHPRLDSLLYLPNEEPVLGYLKFSAKGPREKSLRSLYLTGLVTKRHKPTSSMRSVDSIAEGIPEKEPRVDDEEADVQMVSEESLKSIYDAPRGPLLPVVIREPERTSIPTGSSGHDESSSLYAELGLTDSEVESDEDVPGIDAGVQASQPLPSPVVHAGPNLEHKDLEVTDVSTQPHPEQMDEGFTATAYPKVQENLKLMVEEHVILEEPASSTGTLSSLQHLTKDLSFGDLFFNDKPSEADNEKRTEETEVESMVSVIIQQDTSSIPSMTTPVIDLTSRPESPNVLQPLKATATKITTTTIHQPPSQPQQSTTDSMLMKRIGELEHIMTSLIQDNKHLEERLDNHGACLYILENLDILQQVSNAVDKVVTDAVDWAIQAPLRNCFRDLPKADMKEILHQRMWETNSYKTHEYHMMLYEALEKSMNRDHFEELLKDLAKAHKKKKKRRDSPKTPPGSPHHQPPPPPPPVGPFGASRSLEASGSSQVPQPPSLPPSTNQEDLQMDDDMAPDAQAHSSDDEDFGNSHIPKNNWASALASTYSPPLEDSLLVQTGDIAMFIDWFYESILRHNVSKPLPLGGPPGQVTIQSDFFFNKDLKFLRYGSKGSRPALSISKMKAAYYPNVGLEQMVPDQMWIEEECKHTTEGDRRVVRTHIWILSVVRIEVFSMYGYDYMKKIVLRRADLNEHIFAERDFKYLYPSNFEDMYLLNLQDFQLGIESYQTQLNLTKPRWDATGFEYKHDYTINETLDYRVKEFKVNRMNPNLNTRFWTRKDVDRSKEFMFAI
nr:hypothetical protein [Tanacetum cinerariifolium]